jgi:hypothetical protein
MGCVHKSVDKFSLLGSKRLPFDEDGNLYYFINNYSTHRGEEVQKQLIVSAFIEWNYELFDYNKTFLLTEIKEKAFIQITFVGGSSKIELPNDLKPVLEDAGVIAFCPTGTGNLYINDNIDWSDNTVDLKYSLIHEIGHSLGIAHTNNKDDIMYSEYIAGNRITKDTINAIKQLYTKPNYYINHLSLLDIAFIVVILYLIYTFLN